MLCQVLRAVDVEPGIMRVLDADLGVHVVREVWRTLQREGHRVPRCQVERLVRDLGPAGAVRCGAVRGSADHRPRRNGRSPPG